jgi:hypothetical protein
MKTTLLLLSAFIFLPQALCAQDEERPYIEPIGMNNWYVELGGAALFYSLNYEKVLYKSDGGFGTYGSVGIGYNPFNYRLLNKVYLDRQTMMAPFRFTMAFGKKEKIEAGGGFTLFAKSVNEREYIYTFLLGLRVVEVNKVYFRIAYTPYVRNGEMINWFGVSIGRNFSLK